MAANDLISLRVKHLDLNTKGRDFILSDLHGCHDEFMQLLDAVKFDHTTDRIISVGDLIDRGKNSWSCIELIFETDWFHCVMGNHERMMVDAFLPGKFKGSSFSTDFGTWMANGGTWIADDQSDPNLNQHLAEKLSELPYVIVVGKDTPQRFNVLHAELSYAWDPSVYSDEFLDAGYADADTFQIYEESVLWGRELYNFARHRTEEEIYSICSPYLTNTYVGHTIQKNGKVNMIGNHIFTDTGSFMASYMNVGVGETGVSLIEHSTGDYWTALTTCNKVIKRNIYD
ncbi:hypothetical protein RsoM2USA_237 [Ralstonia phage RsoM2USA]|nr:hypothetical protein RsoM2USA_237 [Ralstonia phage RsoM2USA]